jgi:DNA-binding transcriptional regulator YiaG
MKADKTMTADEFKGIRESWGMKQSEIAELLGVHSMTVSAWERDKQSIPAPVVLLLAALSVLLDKVQLLQARKAK